MLAVTEALMNLLASSEMSSFNNDVLCWVGRVLYLSGCLGPVGLLPETWLQLRED